VDIAFKFIKNQFDLDDKKYENFIEKQSSNGKKGGRPKSKTEQEQILEEDSLDDKENPKNPTVFFKTQKSLNENENENENENVNENVSLLSQKREEGGKCIGDIGQTAYPVADGGKCGDIGQTAYPVVGEGLTPHPNPLLPPHPSPLSCPARDERARLRLQPSARRAFPQGERVECSFPYEGKVGMR
jgi:hypothetical protein